MKVCVTGGAGYIGSHLVAALIQNGHEVTVVDNLENGMRVHSKSRFFSYDIREIDQMEYELQGTEVFFHLAADKRATSKDYYDMVSVNVGGTTAVLEVAKRVGAKRFVLSSSAAVYSEKVKAEAYWEGDPALNAEADNVYGLSKRMAETVSCFMQDENLKVVCLRYFNVFGGEYTPNASVKSVIEHFMDAMSKGKPIKIYGNGTAVRDYVHVDDVVDANLLAMTSPLSTKNSTFNVCTGRGTSVIEVAKLVCGNGYPVEWADGRNEVHRSVGSTKLAEIGLGFTAKRSIQELAAAHT